MMKKLLILLIMVTTFSCSNEREQIRGKSPQSIEHTQKFQDETLVMVDGEVYTVWTWFSSDVYVLAPIHRMGDRIRVKGKYVKSYTPQ